jgi:hypothetical protein
MKEAWQWQEEDIQALIAEQRKEDLRLEYKSSDALAKTDPKKKEITKDVSAMANSAGGVIVYGIDEQKKSNGPIRLDCGIDHNEISAEWLEQVIDSGVQRRIDGVRISPVKMTNTGRFVYLVSVPQSSRAPHMAADHRYHKRLGTTTAFMEEYEVRDVGRRLESPDLHLVLSVRQIAGSGFVAFAPRITNSSPEPALYATCRLYLEAGHGPEVALCPNDNWSRTEDAYLLWNECSIRFQVARSPWSIPSRHPILEGEEYPLDSLQMKVNADARGTLTPCMYRIGWELRAPKAPPRLQGLKMRVDQAGPRIEEQTYTLARP